MDDAEDTLVLFDHERRTAGLRDPFHDTREFESRACTRVSKNCVAGALAYLAAAIDIRTRQAGMSAEGNEPHHLFPQRIDLPSECLADQIDNGLSFRRLVGEGGEKRGFHQFAFRHARRLHEGIRHPVAEVDRARLVEQQRIDIAN